VTTQPQPRPADSPGTTGSGRTPILDVRDLSISFLVDDEWYPAVRDLSYQVFAGEVLAIVGESGSGKTQSSMSLMGLLPVNGRATGSAKLKGEELLTMSSSQLRELRGDEISMIFQEPMTALNPVYTIGFQIIETLRTHFTMSPKRARERALELLELVEIPDPERRIDHFPHQLSGGQRQRAMIAQALACEPKVLVADEPTTALDVTVQMEILQLMHDLRQRIDSAVILITHDMGVVADLADRIVVMKDGRMVETGTAADIFAKPQHPYTQQLLAAVPHFGSVAKTSMEADAGSDAQSAPPTGDVVVVAKDLVLEYPARGNQPVFRAVDQVSFVVNQGEVLGVVGESGSGKTTIGRAIMGLLPVAGGELTVGGINMVGVKQRDLKPLRSKVGIVFQDPGSSLNPRLPIGESIGEPLFLHHKLRGKELAREVEELLDSVQLQRSFRNRYPHELSGGQRQRVGIARALALDPDLLVADEPTSALDVSVQARVLELFKDLQREKGFACVFISHDLGVIEMLCDRIAVMHMGHIVETGSRDQVVLAPKHDYTKLLVAAVPVPDPAEQRRRRAEREKIVSTIHLP
jgi:peptide/nickel transport system ATP-binding protein